MKQYKPLTSSVLYASKRECATDERNIHERSNPAFLTIILLLRYLLSADLSKFFVATSYD